MSRLREIRIERRMTQQELANACGVSQPYIVDLERGARGAKPETMERIALALGVDVSDLTEGNDTTTERTA